MSQQSPTKSQPQQKVQSQLQTTIQPQPKDQKTLKKQKKKKGKALKQFLSKPQNQIIQVVRQQQPIVQNIKMEEINCKICGQLSQRKKLCQFCKEYVCTQHIRKKRKDPKTSKFVRICDQCQDRLLFDKYLKFQNRAEQALTMQQMIIQSKRDQLYQIKMNKQTKKRLLIIKKTELDGMRKDEQNKLKNYQNQINNKQKKYNNKQQEYRCMQQGLNKYQIELPRPLDDDYQRLEQQNSKITKQLVKYQKLCSQALKAKSTREKELYQAYYNWEKKQNNKAAKKKGEECNIY